MPHDSKLRNLECLFWYAPPKMEVNLAAGTRMMKFDTEYFTVRPLNPFARE